MLLLQVLVYVVTQMPWVVWNIYATSTMYITNKSSDRIVIERFISFLVEFILYLFVVLLFYLYISIACLS